MQENGLLLMLLNYTNISVKERHYISIHLSRNKTIKT